MQTKLTELKKYWKPVVSVVAQQIHQNGFPMLPDLNSTYFGTGDSAINVDIEEIDIKSENILSVPSAFSEGDIIRFKLSENNTAGKVSLKFLDNNLVVPIRTQSSNDSILSLDSSLLYTATYNSVDGYFLIDGSSDFSTDIFENNYGVLFNIINSSVSHISKLLDRPLLETDYAYEFEILGINGENTILPVNNINNVSGLFYINENDEEVALDGVLFRQCGYYNEKTFLYLEDDYVTPSDISTTNDKPYKIYFSAGYEGNVLPEDLLQCVKIVSSYRFSNRGDALVKTITDDKKSLDMPDTAKNIINKYRYY